MPKSNRKTSTLQPPIENGAAVVSAVIERKVTGKEKTVTLKDNTAMRATVTRSLKMRNEGRGRLN